MLDGPGRGSAAGVLVHVVADYGPGDLAAAEVRARLALHLPGAHATYTPVGPFDTVAAGFCVAQLALGGGPTGTLVFHNVAPREDDDDPRPDNDGEPLLAARLAGGVLVVGVAAGSTFAFVRDEVDALHEVEVPSTSSQFRSRDAFPALLPRLLEGASLPVVSPLARAAGAPPPGDALNVNADDAAAAVARSLGAGELLLVSDVPAVLVDGRPVSSLGAAEARALIARGVAAGGMAAKLEAALAALDAGVLRVRVGDLGLIAGAGGREAALPGTTLSLERSSA